MIPGARGIFGALLGGISDKYNIPYIFVEWAALLIVWGLYVFFGPERFSSFDVYFLLFILIDNDLLSAQPPSTPKWNDQSFQKTRL